MRPRTLSLLLFFCTSFLLVSLTTVSNAFAQAGAPVDQQSAQQLFTTERNVPIAMRDGIELRADVLRPNVLRPKTAGKSPVLVYRTPYGKDAAQKEYTTFVHAVERGYAVVIVDVRGRYHSGGEFRPYENEGKDGFDTIEWAAAQPWSNGAVGTFGLSYPGAVQWLAAVESPPHLRAMVPAMTFSTPQNFFFAGGTWDMSWMEWIWDNIAWDIRVKKNLSGPHTYDESLAAWKVEGPKMLAALPLINVPQLKEVAPFYFDWLKHPAEDPWWDWSELRNKYDRTHAAVLNLSAWYDDNYGPEGATTNYSGLLKARAADTSSEKDRGTHLLLGPWVHGVDNTAKTKSGEREFGRTAAIDYDDVVLRWMDHYLKGAANGVEKEMPVRYFVMGSNEWRDADVWPPAAERKPLFLGPTTAGQHTGKLAGQASQQPEGFSEFISDPANPVVNEYGSSGAHDYRKLAERDDVLTFDSKILEKDTEITGPIEARVFVSCDCRDLDLWVRLEDLSPDGTAYNLMNPGLDVLRASYRDLGRGRQWLEPGKIYDLDLKNLITSNVFLKGHRIRVQISGSFYPNFSRNLQNGKSEVESAEIKKARIRIYSDAQHASQIVLPFVAGTN
jgi:putative CocE/NonD family hydrolase